MTYYPAAIPLLAIQQLRCPRCRTRMKLARISPGPRGFEIRTFDCARCDHLEQIAIASDPMESDAVGWFCGELRPPRLQGEILGVVPANAGTHNHRCR